ncbi:hypothetical protein DVW12_16940 [Clostridium botulinum]|nr:hypothetical protein [Clostridium botulinum]
MKKKFILLLTAMTLLTVQVPAFASTNYEVKETNQITTCDETSLDEFLATDIAKEFNTKKIDKVPDNSKVLKFDTWDEATDFLQSAKNELDSKYIKNNTLLRSSSPDIPDFDTDYYCVGYASIDSGSGTASDNIDFDVPGASAQTIHSEHYFDYDNNSVTNSSRGSYISGLGIATWKQYYSGLQHPKSKQWNSVIKGHWGYFISVGGSNVGASETVGFWCLCTPD